MTDHAYPALAAAALAAIAAGLALQASDHPDAASLVWTAVAHRRRGDRLDDVPVDAVMPGDVVVVRSGDIVPADGIVASASAIVDESTLTGESLPATYGRGSVVRSGIANAAAPFDLRATRPAAQSAYAALVRLVEAARGDRAPFARLADRYAALLLPVTLLVAGGAWAIRADAHRAPAVVVVALVQEGIDVAVILNTLRALRG